MSAVHRPSVKVGSCTTLSEAGVDLGGSKHLLHNHSSSPDFPKIVAQFGHVKLYVKDELSAFYQSVLWRQSDRSYNELTGS